MTPTNTTCANHPSIGIVHSRKVGRLSLPVAPRANLRVRFDATGKATSAIMPDEAVSLLEIALSEGRKIDLVCICGPGDPLAQPEPAIRTLRMVREKFPEMPLCMTTYGLGGEMYAPELAAIGLSHVTLLVDAVIPKVAEELYAWIRPSTKNMPLPEAAKLLVNEQAKAVDAFKNAGITVRIKTTVYPGVNAGHIEEIASTMAVLGADIMEITPFHMDGDGGDILSEPGTELMTTVRDRAARHIELAPAWDDSIEETPLADGPTVGATPLQILPKPTKERPNVAVVSSDGIDVDLHLGHAIKVLVYGPREDGLKCLLEAREAPEPGSGSARWKKLADILSDCFVLLAASAGDKPKEILCRKGLHVIVTDGEIEGTVDVLYGGGKKGKKSRN